MVCLGLGWGVGVGGVDDRFCLWWGGVGVMNLRSTTSSKVVRGPQSEKHCSEQYGPHPLPRLTSSPPDSRCLCALFAALFPDQTGSSLVRHRGKRVHTSPKNASQRLRISLLPLVKEDAAPFNSTIAGDQSERRRRAESERAHAHRAKWNNGRRAD
uniref:Secreted protein n=1 Tax=Knipowitschia caucasica TaxID=637954 RepID=A0AAV2MCU6_KNICA